LGKANRSFRHTATATLRGPATRIACKQRRGIERFFATFRQWPRIATRHDKITANFLRLIKLGRIMLWLK
jgi:transposase